MSDVDESMDDALSNMKSVIGSQILDSVIETKHPGNQFKDNNEEVNDAYGMAVKKDKKNFIGTKDGENSRNHQNHLKKLI